MRIIGCKYDANFSEAAVAIHKHTGKSLTASRKMIDTILDGKSVELPDDFVLREDLEYANFLFA